MLRPALALALFLVAGCAPDARTVSLPTSVSSSEAEAIRFTQTFADDRSWTQDAAGNHLQIDYQPSDAADAIAIHWRDNGQEKGILRKELALDLTTATSATLSCHSDTAVALTIAWRSAKGAWFECPWQELEPGWHRDLRFDLTALSGPTWPAQARQIRRVNILIKPAGTETGTVLLERFAVQGPDAVLTGTHLDTVSADAAPSHGRVGEPLAWSLTSSFQARHRPDDYKPYLERMRFGRLEVTTPAGHRLKIDGVCTGIDEDGQHRFAYRWTPKATGPHRARLGWHNGRRWIWQDPVTVGIDPPAADLPASFIRVDPSDPTQLIDAAGRPFWPVGQNLAWMGDPVPWLDRLHEAGGNLARVWLCPWHLDLSNDGSLAHVDFAAADQLDRLFTMAQERGIQIQLVLFYHGLIGHDWASNPEHHDNGGPVHLAEEFWTDRRSRRRVKELLRYIVHRWGHAPNLFAWELLNEANLTRRFDDDDIIDWHRDMGRLLRDSDMHGHLITTSTSHAGALGKLWDLASIDLVQAHAYTPQIAPTIAKVSALTPRKPVMLAEFGRDWRPSGDQNDPLGLHLRTALYASWCSPLAGSSMPWWWDTQIEANDLMPLYAGFSRWIAGLDRQGQAFRSFTTRLHRDDGPVVVAQGITGRSRSYVHLHAPAVVSAANLPATPVLAKGARLTLTGLADGAWTVRFWNPGTGTAISTTELTASEGRAVLTLPQVDVDLAIDLTGGVTTPTGARLEANTVEAW